MNKTVKILLGTCGIVLIVTGAFLGLEYAAVIAALNVGIRTGLKHALKISSEIGVVLIAGDFIYSLWQATENKEKF
jgi:hypothetical protein